MPAAVGVMHARQVKVSYGVTWREAGLPDASGQLEIEAGALVLRCADEAADGRMLAFDELTGLEIRPPAERPTLLLRGRDAREVELGSAVGAWVLSGLLERLFLDMAERPARGEHVLVSLRLKPGCREEARALLEAGPPFDPAALGLGLHDVFLLDDEVLFLFEPGGDGEKRVHEHPDFWAATDAWQALAAGEARLAEAVFRWQRPAVGPATVPRFGLGF